MTQRTKLGMLVAEFFGTAILTSAIITQANYNTMMINRMWFVGATAGLALMLLTLAIGEVSGAVVNPALTVALWTLRKIDTTTAVVFMAVQMLGAAVALRLFEYLQGDVLQSAAGAFEWRVFVAEAVGTFVFSFGVAAVITQKLNGLKAAFGVGVSLMLGVIIASVASNGFLNPAVAFGDNSWSWTYAAAPVLGAVLGMNLYDLFLAPESSFKGSLVMHPSRSLVVESPASAARTETAKTKAKKTPKKTTKSSKK